MTGLLVHEWIENFGGAEQVVAQLRETFPDSKTLALWNSSDNSYWADVQVSWLGKHALLNRSKAAALPLMPLAWRTLPRETAYDWAIVSSHLFAHQVDLRKIVPSGRKLVYVHSPARYLWEPEIDPRASSLALKIFGASLRSFDRSSACSGAKRIAVNSKFVRARVAKSWGLDSEVIYPPVRLGRLGSLQESAVLDELNLPEEFLLAVSRLVPYKRTEIALEIAAKMETAIVIVGSGSEEKKLRTYALQIGAKAHFMGAVEDQVLTLLYRRAKALIFPAIEDFGIIPVEAMSFGLPVIGNKLGGVSETVSDGVSGFLIDFASTSEAVGKVRDAERLSREDCLEVAQKFSTERFSSAMTNWVENSS